MADLAWCRFGSRPRTPVPLPSPPPSEQPSTGQAAVLSRRPAVSRVPSRLGLHSRVSPTKLLTPAAHTDILMKEQEKIWHNPSLDQMLQSLQVAIMTNGTMQPMPVPYNTYVLHLIEYISDHRERLAAADAACEEINEARSQAREDLRIVSDEWLRRETQYKAEIKRLEVLLAQNSQQGLETVTLARADSLVERDQPDARKFVSRLRTLRDEMATRESSEPSVAELESSVSLGPSIMTDTRIMRIMEPSQPVKQQRGASHEQFQKVPIPNILDREMDLRQSQTMRRADAAAAVTSTRAGGQEETYGASAEPSRPRPSSPSSISESEHGRLGATAAAEPAKRTQGIMDVAAPAAPLKPTSARRLDGAETGARDDVDDDNKAGSRHPRAGVVDMPQVMVHSNNTSPQPNKAGDGHFSFVPGDDNLLATNSQSDGHSISQAREKASRLRHGEDKSATGRAHPPSPQTPCPPPHDDLAARGQGPRTASTAAISVRGAESSGCHGHGLTGSATTSSLDWPIGPQQNGP